jgi:hypothetical protein
MVDRHMHWLFLGIIALVIPLPAVAAAETRVVAACVNSSDLCAVDGALPIIALPSKNVVPSLCYNRVILLRKSCLSA